MSHGARRRLLQAGLAVGGLAIAAEFVDRRNDNAAKKACFPKFNIAAPGRSVADGGAWSRRGSASSAPLSAATARPRLRAEEIAAARLGATGSGATAAWDYNWDHRQPTPQPTNANETDENSNNLEEKPLLPKPKAVRNLLLIRHGQYHVWGATDGERVLTGLGREQAAATGRRLAQLGLPYTAVIRSSMARARETADLICAELPSSAPPVSEPACDLIREGGPISPEPPLRARHKDDSYWFVDGARIEAGFRKYFHRADPLQEDETFEVVVCHANVIRYFVCRALQIPAEAWLRMSLRHASITWIAIRPNGHVSLRCLGDAGHLPPDKLTTQ